MKRHANILRGKAHEHIRDYGLMFCRHLSEKPSEEPVYSDQVPKEDVNRPETLERVGMMALVHRKVREYMPPPLDAAAAADEEDAKPVDGDVAFSAYWDQAVNHGQRFHIADGGFTILHSLWRQAGPEDWGRHQDFVLLAGLLKHGWGNWLPIQSDQRLQLLPVLRREVLGHKPPSRSRSSQPKRPASPASPATTTAADGADDDDAAAAAAADGDAMDVGLDDGDAASQQAPMAVDGDDGAEAADGADAAEAAPAPADAAEAVPAPADAVISVSDTLLISKFLVKRVRLLTKALAAEDQLLRASALDIQADLSTPEFTLYNLVHGISERLDDLADVAEAAARGHARSVNDLRTGLKQIDVLFGLGKSECVDFHSSPYAAGLFKERERKKREEQE